MVTFTGEVKTPEKKPIDKEVDEDKNYDSDSASSTKTNPDLEDAQNKLGHTTDKKKDPNDILINEQDLF